MYQCFRHFTDVVIELLYIVLVFLPAFGSKLCFILTFIHITLCLYQNQRERNMKICYCFIAGCQTKHIWQTWSMLFRFSRKYGNRKSQFRYCSVSNFFFTLKVHKRQMSYFRLMFGTYKVVYQIICVLHLLFLLIIINQCCDRLS